MGEDPKDEAMSRIHVQQLPDDLQVLLDEMLATGSDAGIRDRLWTHAFTVRHVPLSRFPRNIAFSDYRKENYAREMVGCNLPPIVLCGNLLLDGKHRIWVARREGRKTIAAIDLAEIRFCYPFQPACELTT